MSRPDAYLSDRDVRELERISDRAFRALNEIRDALIDRKDPARARKKVIRAVSEIGEGLDDLALRRARRYLRSQEGEQ